MDGTVRIRNLTLPLSLDKATIIHANKYSRADGTISPFVFSTLHTEVVFRLKDTDEDMPLYVQSLDLPIYPGQEVLLIRISEVIVGYIDVRSKLYYYANDISKRLGLGIPGYWVWIIGVIGGITVVSLFRNESMIFWMFIPVIGAWLLYILQKLLFDYQLRKSINSVLR